MTSERGTSAGDELRPTSAFDATLLDVDALRYDIDRERRDRRDDGVAPGPLRPRRARGGEPGLYDDAVQLRTLANIAIGAATVLVATGVVLLVVAPPRGGAARASALELDGALRFQALARAR